MFTKILCSRGERSNKMDGKLEIYLTVSRNDQSNNLHVYVESVTCAAHENTA